MTIFKKYIPLKPSESRENALEVKVSYDASGYSCFSSTPITRGYYLYVIPVERCEIDDGHGGTLKTTRTTVFKGRKLLIKEVSRRCSSGSKSEAAIIATAIEREAEVVKIVCDEYGLEVDE